MQNNGRLQIARGVRIMAVRDGAVILSPNDRFRIRERSEYSFVSDFIPKLYQSETLSGTPRELLPDWFPVVCRDLQQVGILSCLQDEELTVYRDDKTPRIGIVRKTLLTDCVAQQLNTRGLTVEDSPCNSDFTIADFTGLDAPTSLEQARRIYESGTASISV